MVENALRADIMAGVEYVCQRMGHNAQSVVNAMAARYARMGHLGQPQQAQNYDPAVADANAQVAAMARDKESFPFFAQLRPAMFQLVNTGRATTLIDATPWRLASTPRPVKLQRRGARPSRTLAMQQNR